MISERDILNAIQGKLETLELFQTIRQPGNRVSDHDLLDLLPDLTQFPAAVLLARRTSQSDTHLSSTWVELTVIGRYFGLESERTACETLRETVTEAFRQTSSATFQNKGQLLIVLEEIVPVVLGNEYMAWNIGLEAKCLNY